MALIETGKTHGPRQIGSRAYASAVAESGWVPSPLPATYTGDKMRPSREWLAGNRFGTVICN